MRKALIIIFWMNVLSSTCFAQNYRGGVLFKIKGTETYCAAVKTEYFQEYVATQRSDNWCWAACIEMVLRYQGVDITQEQIVKKVFGDLIDRPASADVIVNAANGFYVNGKRIEARNEYAGYVSAKSFIDDLAHKYPVIIGLTMPGQNVGHAYVMTGITFREYGNTIYPQKVILRNPWPHYPARSSREELSWDEFKSRVHTIVHIFPVN